MRYVDPDGRDIEVLDDTGKVLESINNYSYYRYKIDENHYLVRDGNKTNKGNASKKYSAVLDAAIDNHLGTIKIAISDKTINKHLDGTILMDYAVELEGGGGCTYNFSKSLKLVTITGRDSIYDIPMENGTTHKFAPEEILMHELVGHAIPMMLNKTGGSAIFNENTIRKELGINERKETNKDSVVNHNSNGKFLFMPN